MSTFNDMDGPSLDHEMGEWEDGDLAAFLEGAASHPTIGRTTRKAMLEAARRLGGSGDRSLLRAPTEPSPEAIEAARNVDLRYASESQRSGISRRETRELLQAAYLVDFRPDANPWYDQVCGHAFDHMLCVAQIGHDGPHVTSNERFPIGLRRGAVDGLRGTEDRALREARANEFEGLVERLHEAARDEGRSDMGDAFVADAGQRARAAFDAILDAWKGVS